VPVRGRLLSLLVATAMLSGSVPAWSQRSGIDSKAAAEALFDHAKRLHAQGRYAEACPKFAESQKLDAGIGTLLYLADCYEKNGQTASAWAGFREAAAAAKAANQLDREKIARDRAVAIEPSLSRLTITVEASNTLDGVEVTRNGTPVGKALWGTPIPVDPGRHRIEASARGKKPWSARVDVGSSAANASIHVPRLVEAPKTPEQPATDPDGGSDGSGQRAVGLVLGGLGVVGIGVGAAFGVQAISKDSDADGFCDDDDPSRCQQEGVDLGDQAATAATLSTIAFGVGAAALVAGAVVFFTAPKSGASGPRKGRAAGPTVGAAPAWSPGFGGVSVRGAF
jgi:hypothetical protein